MMTQFNTLVKKKNIKNKRNANGKGALLFARLEQDRINRKIGVVTQRCSSQRGKRLTMRLISLLLHDTVAKGWKGSIRNQMRLAEKFDCHPGSISRIIKQLEDDGILRRKQRGFNQAKRYILAPWLTTTNALIALKHYLPWLKVASVALLMSGITTAMHDDWSAEIFNHIRQDNFLTKEPIKRSHVNLYNKNDFYNLFGVQRRGGYGSESDGGTSKRSKSVAISETLGKFMATREKSQATARPIPLQDRHSPVGSTNQCDCQKKEQPPKQYKNKLEFMQDPRLAKYTPEIKEKLWKAEEKFREARKQYHKEE
jgi:DNA-binding MarR family transcriptional regulator